MDKQPGGDLRNTLYRQETRSGRRMTRGRRWLYRLAAPLIVFLGQLVWRWTRVVAITGTEHIGAQPALARQRECPNH